MAWRGPTSTTGGCWATPTSWGGRPWRRPCSVFGAEGAWGVSPHLIPQRCLHALSGTVSQALKVHGPNFGVGGGPGGPAEVLLAATSMLHCRHLPGVWAVLTSLYPNVPPDPDGRPPAGSLCVGLTLALVHARSARPGIRCASRPAAPEGPAPQVRAGVNTPPTQPLFDLFRLEYLLGRVDAASPGELAVVQVLDAGSQIELSKTVALEWANGRRPQAGPRPRPVERPLHPSLTADRDQEGEAPAEPSAWARQDLALSTRPDRRPWRRPKREPPIRAPPPNAW